MKLKRYLPLVAAAALVPSLGLAQEAEEVAEAVSDAVTVEMLGMEMVFIFNTLLFLIGGFLVFFMAAGFCMLETGLVRSKNATMQLTKNVALFSLAAIAYYLIGFNLMYPLGDWVIEGWMGGIAPTVLEPVGVPFDELDDVEYASIGSDFFVQLMFCAAVASIVSGAVAERIKLWPFLIFVSGGYAPVGSGLRVALMVRIGRRVARYVLRNEVPMCLCPAGRRPTASGRRCLCRGGHWPAW